MGQITKSGPGLLVGIPTLGRPVPLSWATSYKSMAPPINFSTNVITLHGKPVDEARNEIAEYALKLGSKYVFFLGDDVVVPPNILKQLIYWMEQRQDIGIVTAVYCSKSEPPAPLVFRGNGAGTYWDWKVGEFFEITGCGMDAVLIRSEIFRKVTKPWFKTVDTDDFDKGINNADQWTEDLYFCKKVLEETDYKIYCDSSLLCEHWDVYANKAYTLPAGSLPTQRRSSMDKKKAVDIGCGPINRSDEFPDHSLVRVDIREDCNPDYRCDVRNLPFASEEFDLVFSSHVLEHFPRAEWVSVLREWVRLIKNDGEIILVLPNIKWAFSNLDGNQREDALNVLYGAQSNPFDFHMNGFWPARIQDALKLMGIKEIDITEQHYNMIIRGKKEV